METNQILSDEALTTYIEIELRKHLVIPNSMVIPKYPEGRALAALDWYEADIQRLARDFVVKFKAQAALTASQKDAEIAELKAEIKLLKSVMPKV